MERTPEERQARGIIDAEYEGLAGLSNSEIVDYLLALLDGLDKEKAEQIVDEIF